jgi:hypothetical protein
MVATRGKGADRTTFSYVMCSTPFEIPVFADFAEMKIKQVSRVHAFTLSFGLAPAELMSDRSRENTNCGYHCTTNLTLYDESVENGVRFNDGTIKQNSIVQIRLHRDQTVSIVLDGEDLGVAFRDVNTEEPLYLVVGMWCKGDCVELLGEHV